MTHDELLAQITNHMLYIVQTGFNDYKTHKALRAVVELHKPSEPISDDGFITCETCNYEYFREYPYPCETIQAIEKELA